MKRFRLTYNGIVSEFNGFKNGYSRSGDNYGYSYSVRPSKTNIMQITKLIEVHEGENIEYHFYCKNRVPRGLKVKVEVI